MLARNIRPVVWSCNWNVIQILTSLKCNGWRDTHRVKFIWHKRLSSYYFVQTPAYPGGVLVCRWELYWLLSHWSWAALHSCYVGRARSGLLAQSVRYSQTAVSVQYHNIKLGSMRGAGDLMRSALHYNIITPACYSWLSIHCVVIIS